MNLIKTFLFYDLETTGLNKSFDQIIQFAAIRTDTNLTELERFEFKIRLNPDVFPSPEAILTHKQGIKQLQQGITEYSAIKKIHALMNTPGTISLGYNTLGFDNEFLRFSFYRNLLPPYTHQYSNNCMRMDIYPIAIMYFLFATKIITWPKQNDKISLKLENINLANQFCQGPAHNAMTDVEITLALAKKLKTNQKMWDYVCGYFYKNIDKTRIEKFNNTPALMLQGKLGAKNYYQCPVIYLGKHAHYKNQLLWLRLDQENLSSTTNESIAENTYVLAKKIAEPGFLLPFNEKYYQYVTKDRLITTEKNLTFLTKNPALLSNIQKYHANVTWPKYPTADLQSRLYTGGFLQDAELAFCQNFHAANLAAKQSLISTAPTERIKQLATRIIARNYPFDEISNDIKQNYQDYYTKCSQSNYANKLIDFQGTSSLQPKIALDKIEHLLTEKLLSVKDTNLLIEYKQWLHDFIRDTDIK